MAYHRMNASRRLMIPVETLVGILLLLATACDMSGGSDSVVSPIVKEPLEGTWLKTFPEGSSFAYRENGEADAIIFDIDRWDFTAIFYRDTEQVGGFTGPYRIVPDPAGGSQSTILVTAAYIWNETWDFEFHETAGLPTWIPESEPREYSFPCTWSATVLLMETEDPVNPLITLDRTPFRCSNELAYRWYQEEPGTTIRRFRVNGNYSGRLVIEGEEFNIEDGKWSASGSGSGLVRILIAELEDADETDRFRTRWEFLHPYRLEGNTLYVTEKEGLEVTYLDVES